MGSSRQDGTRPHLVALWAVALALATAASADAARIANVTPQDPGQLQDQIDRVLSPVVSASSIPAARVGSRAKVSERPISQVRTTGYAPRCTVTSYSAAGRSRAAQRSRPARPFVGIAVVAAILLLMSWRSSASAASRQLPASRKPAPNDVVCLACARCHRVVDLPQHRLSRHLFCPRCGATLPRNA
jgi:hypothetical protein